jgi:hypothetical protein
VAAERGDSVSHTHRIRIKGCEYLTHSDGQEQKAQDWFAKRAWAYKPKKMELWELKVYVGGKYLYTNQKTQKDEYLIVRQTAYEELGEDYYDKLTPRRTASRLIRRLQGMGYTVTQQLEPANVA